MKKSTIIAVLITITITSSFAYAYCPAVNRTTHITPRVNLGLNYGNSVITTPIQQSVNRVVITTHNPTDFITPPPPQPPRHKYRYKDFAGERRYPKRSYYIPSYCMPNTTFYADEHNPFCNHYRPYGSNMYLSF